VIDLVVGDVGEHPDQPCLRIDTVHPAGFDERVGDGCGFAAAFRTYEEIVFSSESQGPDRPLANVVIQLQLAVLYQRHEPSTLKVVCFAADL
jgi:hypothetical protein